MQTKIDNNYLERQYKSLPFIVAYLCHTKNIALFKCVKKRFERKVKVLENDFQCLERKLFFETYISIYEFCQESNSKEILNQINALKLYINDSETYTQIYDAVRLLVLGYKIQKNESAEEIIEEIKEIDDTAFSHEFREAMLSCFDRKNGYSDKDVENFVASSIIETHKNRILEFLISIEEEEFQDLSFDTGIMEPILQQYGYKKAIEETPISSSTPPRRMNEEHDSAVEESFTDSIHEFNQRKRCRWTYEEDTLFVEYLRKHKGRLNWNEIPKTLKLDKTPIQCQNHYKNMMKKTRLLSSGQLL